MCKKYALCVLRDNKSPYCIPMPLEEIDNIFIKYKNNKAGILKRIHEFDSVMDETDPSKLEIRVLINGKWKYDKDLTIISDAEILTFSIKDLFSKLNKSNGYIKDMKNHFQKYLKYDTTSEIFKETILNGAFIDNFFSLSYDEQRLIRLYIVSKIDIKKYLNKNKEANIEVLEIPDEEFKLTRKISQNIESKAA